MKYLLKSIITLIMTIIVSIILLPIGFIYSLGYSFWLAITYKNVKGFFTFWWRLIDGLAYALGFILHNTAVGLDLTWNVNGEILEDMVTPKEDTTFTNKGITVSASVGKLEVENDLNKYGKIFSRVLNFAFQQKAHAVDSWNVYVKINEINSKHFK